MTNSFCALLCISVGEAYSSVASWCEGQVSLYVTVESHLGKECHNRAGCDSRPIIVGVGGDFSWEVDFGVVDC